MLSEGKLSQKYAELVKDKVMNRPDDILLFAVVGANSSPG